MSVGHPKRNKPVIGLSGGIAAGKSAVARILASLGAVVVDSDRLGQEELNAPEVVAKLRQWWGESVFDGSGRVNRDAVASIVFADPAELARLEGLIHPRVRRRRQELMGAADADPAVRAMVLDSPKLYETGLHELCDAVVFVEADRQLRVRRAERSRGWTTAVLEQRENLQIPLDEKKAAADYRVVNHSGFDELRGQVGRVFAAVLAAFS